MFAARALYSNVSESPEELSFNQGDVLTILQKDFNGLSGWWLCFIDGRVGLAPGNRLRVLSRAEVEDGCQPVGQPKTKDTDERFNEESNPDIGADSSSNPHPIYDVPPASLERKAPSPRPDQLPRSSIRPSEVESSNEVTYDTPPRRTEIQEPEYQVPRSVRTNTMPGTGSTEVPKIVLTKSPDGDGENAMGAVRVCVEDDDDLSSEEFVAGSHHGKKKTDGKGAPRLAAHSGEVDQPPSGQPTYDLVPTRNAAIGQSTQKFVGQPSSPRVDLPYHGGVNSRHSFDAVPMGEVRTAPEFDRIGKRCRSAVDPRFKVPEPVQKSPEDRVFQKLGLDSSRNPDRDSLLEDYSVPRHWSTLPPPQSRPPTELQIYKMRPEVVHDFTNSSGKTRKIHPERHTLDGQYRAAKGGEPNGSQGTSEYQLAFVDTGIYVDCPQDPDSVSDMMASLERTVRVQVGNIREICVGFDYPTGTLPDADVTQMKMSCLSLRTALKEFADLGTGALATAMQATNRDLSENILQQLEVLRVLSQDFDSSVDLVIRATQRKGTGEAVPLRDALNSLMTLTHDIEQPLAILTDLVGTSSAVIFTAGRALSPSHTPFLGHVPEMRPSSPSMSLVPVTKSVAIREVRSPSPNIPSLQNHVPVVSIREMHHVPSNIPAIQNIQQVSIQETRSPSPNMSFQNNYPGGLPIREMRSPSPNLPPPVQIQPPPCGCFLGPHGFESTGAGVPFVPSSSSPSSSPMSDVAPAQVYRCKSPSQNAPLGEFRAVSPVQHLQDIPDAGKSVTMVTGTAPPKLSMHRRPLPPLPDQTLAEHPGWRSSSSCSNNIALTASPSDANDAADWNSVDKDYVSIANEAERDVQQNVRILVGRLADRTRFDNQPQSSELMKPEATRRTSGLSPQFKERLDALRPSTEQTMRITCARSRDATSGPSSSQLAGYFSDFLFGMDREIVHFYVDQVNGHYEAVDMATGDFLRAVAEGSSIGSDLVALSRKVVLAAHKLLYAGDAITKKLVNDAELRRQVGIIAGELCLRLKVTVAASKADSDAGASLRRQKMLECMADVRLLSVSLRDVIFAHLFDKIN